MTSLERHDPEAELAVVGSALLDSTAHALAAAVVTADDFHDPRLAVTWRALCALAERGSPTHDVTLVLAELRALDRLTAAGGPEHIASITDTIPTTAHVERFAQIVAEHATCRRLAAAGQRIASHAADPTHRVDACLAHATAALSEATTRIAHNTTPLSDALGQVFARLERANESGGSRVIGHATGFGALDRLTCGLGEDQLWVVAARPSMGKTALALQIAARVASNNGPVLFVSLEMSANDLATRLLASEARVSLGLIRSLTIGGDTMGSLVSTAERIHAMPLEIADSGAATITGVRAMALRQAARARLALVVVDYLQLMSGSGQEDNREGEVSAISRGLKLLAKELKCPVLALSQLNRKCEERKDKRPMLSDLRESGAIEQDADVVAFIYRDEIYDKASTDSGTAEVILAKQRNGPTDTVRLRFIRELTRFEPLEQEEPQTVSVYGNGGGYEYTDRDD